MKVISGMLVNEAWLSTHGEHSSTEEITHRQKCPLPFPQALSLRSLLRWRKRGRVSVKTLLEILCPFSLLKSGLHQSFARSLKKQGRRFAPAIYPAVWANAKPYILTLNLIFLSRLKKGDSLKRPRGNVYSECSVSG